MILNSPPSRSWPVENDLYTPGMENSMANTAIHAFFDHSNSNKVSTMRL